MKSWQVAIVALLVGCALGFVARPHLVTDTPRSAPADSTPSAVQPSEEEAIEAVRRFRIADPLVGTPQATLKLGACAPSKITTGTECMATLVARPGASPQIKPIGFALIGGRWEKIY